MVDCCGEEASTEFLNGKTVVYKKQGIRICHGRLLCGQDRYLKLLRRLVTGEEDVLRTDGPSPTASVKYKEHVFVKMKAHFNHPLLSLS